MTASQASGPGVGAGPHLAGDTDAAPNGLATGLAVKNQWRPVECVGDQLSKTKNVALLREIASLKASIDEEAVPDREHQDMARANALVASTATVATSAASVCSAANSPTRRSAANSPSRHSAANSPTRRSAANSPTRELCTAADRGPRGGSPFSTAELLWALARSEKRRAALEEQLRALRAPFPSSAEQQRVARSEKCRTSLTVNVPAAEDLPKEMAVRRQAADMAGAGGLHAEKAALMSSSHSEGLLQPLPEYTAVCMPLGGLEQRDETSRRTASADRAQRRAGGASVALGSRQRSHSEKRADVGGSGLQAELSKMPLKLAVQLRRGFSTLTAEVQALRIRHEQQLLRQQQLRAQIVSREALNDRLGALEAEKMAYGEWISLQTDVPKEGFTVLVDAKKQLDRDSMVQEAEVLARELLEQHLMLKEDLLSEQYAHRELRATPGQLCEELCVLLHHCEEALRTALAEESQLRKSTQIEQARLSRSGTPSRSSDLRLLHQKLATLRKQDPKRNPFRDRRTL